MKSLNLNNRKSHYWSVTLRDGRTLSLRVATKRVYDMMCAMGGESTSDDLVETVAAVLSCNREGIVVTPEDVTEMGFDDVNDILDGYGEFLTEVLAENAKN